MSAITSLIIGILTILLASFLTNAIQIITGIWLIVSGLNKLGTAPYYKSSSNRYYTITLIVSVLLISINTNAERNKITMANFFAKSLS